MNRTKRLHILAAVLFAVLITLSFSFSAFGASTGSGSCGENATWSLSNGVLTIGGTGSINSNDGWINNKDEIVSIVIGNGITSIEDYIFQEHTNVVTLSLGQQVSFIGWKSFQTCKSLQTVTFPQSIKTIGGYSFDGCISLTKVTVPDITGTVAETRIEQHAFSGDSKLVTVTIGNGVNYIGDAAFADCPLLKNLTIGARVENIDDYAFVNDVALETLTIPDSVTGIGEYAFQSCTALKTISFGKKLSSIGWKAFQTCKSLQTVTFPQSIKTIGGYSFDGCISLTNVTVPDITGTVAETRIEQHAFSGDSKLVTVTIGNGVIYIGNAAFADCPLLKNLTIGARVENIDDYAFVNDVALETLTIPDSVTGIGEYAFQSCTALKTVSFGKKLSSIGWKAFQTCKSLQTVTFPQSIKTIGGYSFDGCISLTNVTVPDITGTVAETRIEQHAFSGDSKLVTVTIGNGVNYIGNAAFADCSLLKNLTIGARVENIDDYAFVNDVALETLTIPDSVTGIGEYVFQSCTALKTISFGKNLSSIGWKAFQYCSSLAKVTFPKGIVTIGGYSFANCSNLKVVRMESSDKVYTDQEIGQRAFQNDEKLLDIQIGTGVNTIGAYAFDGCTATPKKIYYGNSKTDWDQISIGEGNENLTPILYNTLPPADQTVITIKPTVGYAFVSFGSNATVSVTASGGAAPYTYAWYYKDVGASAFSKSSVSTASYSYPITSARNGRTVYCVVTDNNGTSVKSPSIPMFAPEIPTSVNVMEGVTCNFALKSLPMIGSPYTYAWYYKDPGQSSYTKCQSTTGSVTFNGIAGRDGRQVYCLVTDKNGKTAKSNVATMHVIRKLAITTQPKNVTVSAGINATFSVTASGTGLTYAWYYKDTGASAFSKSASTSNSVTYTTSMDRNGRKVYCVVTDKNGNTEQSNTVTLTVVPAPKITAQPKNVTVSAGINATFSVTATGTGLTYAWYYKDTGASAFSKSASTSNSVTYTTSMDRNGRKVYCVVTDKYGNTVKSNTVTLTVVAAPKITAQPKNVTVAAGTSATFSVTATGTGLTYAWYYKDTGASAFSKSASTTNSVTYTTSADRNGRKVYCVVTDKYGNTVKSNTVTLTVTSGLAITAQPKNVTVNAGTNATFSVTATGTGLTYAWYYKDPGASAFSKSASTTNSVTYSTSADRNGRKVYCVVTDKYGNTVKSNTVTLTVVSGLAITSQPKNVTVKAGTNATFSVTATGSGLSYFWYYKDQGSATFTKSASTTNSVTYTTSAARNGRQVYCRIIDAEGNTVKSNTVTLTVQ